METGWVPGDAHPGAGPSQPYSSWPENLLAFDLEGGNYGPTLSGGASSKLASGGLADDEVQRKRKRELLEKESLDLFLAELGKDPPPPSAPEAAGSGSNEDAAGLAGLEGDRRTDAKLPDAASAARNKACRERMRRERLNDSFTELSKVLEPGKQVKIDKTSIIADAIRAITQLRSESNQLRQLNKFLEERVGQCEKQKSDLMLQQAMLQGASGGAHAFGMPHQGMMHPAGLAGMDTSGQHGMQQMSGIHPAFLASMQQMQHQQQQQVAQQPLSAQPQQPSQQLTHQQMGGSQQQMGGSLPQQLHTQQAPSHQQQQQQQQMGSMLGTSTTPLGASHPTGPEHTRQSGIATTSLEQNSHSGLGTPRSNQSMQPGSALDSRMQAPQQQQQQSAIDLPGMSFSFMGNPVAQQQQQQQQQMAAAGMRAEGSLGHGFPGGMVKHESHLGGMAGMDPLARISSSPLGLVAGIPIAGPGCWLPPSTLDTSQDHMRRPPAA